MRYLYWQGRQWQDLTTHDTPAGKLDLWDPITCERRRVAAAECSPERLVPATIGSGDEPAEPGRPLKGPDRDELIALGVAIRREHPTWHKVIDIATAISRQLLKRGVSLTPGHIRDEISGTDADPRRPLPPL